MYNICMLFTSLELSDVNLNLSILTSKVEPFHTRVKLIIYQN